MMSPYMKADRARKAQIAKLNNELDTRKMRREKRMRKKMTEKLGYDPEIKICCCKSCYRKSARAYCAVVIGGSFVVTIATCTFFFVFSYNELSVENDTLLKYIAVVLGLTVLLLQITILILALAQTSKLRRCPPWFQMMTRSQSAFCCYCLLCFPVCPLALCVRSIGERIENGYKMEDITTKETQQQFKQLSRSEWVEWEAQRPARVAEMCSAAAEHEARCLRQLVQHTWLYEDNAGRDARGLEHSGIANIRVQKVHNPSLWSKYQAYLAKDTGIEFPLNFFLVNQPILTTTPKVDGKSVDSLLHLDPAKEVILFHGTKSTNVSRILDIGLRIDHADLGLYGRGIYLAESAQKSDQYADKSACRQRRGLKILAVRVALGKLKLYQDKGEPPNTVLCGSDKKFREFVIFNSEQCYVEYVIEYDRIVQEGPLSCGVSSTQPSPAQLMQTDLKM